MPLMIKHHNMVSILNPITPIAVRKPSSVKASSTVNSGLSRAVAHEHLINAGSFIKLLNEVSFGSFQRPETNDEVSSLSGICTLVCHYSEPFDHLIFIFHNNTGISASLDLLCPFFPRVMLAAHSTIFPRSFGTKLFNSCIVRECSHFDNCSHIQLHVLLP